MGRAGQSIHSYGFKLLGVVLTGSWNLTMTTGKVLRHFNWGGQAGVGPVVLLKGPVTLNIIVVNSKMARTSETLPSLPVGVSVLESYNCFVYCSHPKHILYS